MDSGDMVALGLVAQIENDMALDSESVDPDEAGRLYRQSLEACMQRWEIVEHTLSTRRRSTSALRTRAIRSASVICP